MGAGQRNSTFRSLLVATVVFAACGDDDSNRDAATDASGRDASVSDARDRDSSSTRDAGECIEPPDPKELFIYGNNFSILQFDDIPLYLLSQMRETPSPPEPRMREGSCVQHSLYDSFDWYTAPDTNYGDVRFGNENQFVLFVRQPFGPSMEPLRAPYPTYTANSSSYAGFAPGELVTVQFLGESSALEDAGVATVDGGVTMASASLRFPPAVTSEEIMIPSSWALGEPLAIELNLPESTPRDTFVFLFGGGRGYPGGVNDGGRQQIYFITCAVSVCDSTLEVPAAFRTDFGGTTVPTRQFGVGLTKVVPIEGAPLDATAVVANAVFKFVALEE